MLVIRYNPQTEGSNFIISTFCETLEVSSEQCRIVWCWTVTLFTTIHLHFCTISEHCHWASIWNPSSWGTRKCLSLAKIWWRHNMETTFVLLALCDVNQLVISGATLTMDQPCCTFMFVPVSPKKSCPLTYSDRRDYTIYDITCLCFGFIFSFLLFIWYIVRAHTSDFVIIRLPCLQSFIDRGLFSWWKGWHYYVYMM